MSEQAPGGVMPMIQVRSVEETRNFYVDRLGFDHQMAVVGKDGDFDFCNLTLGSAMLMFTRAEQPIEAGPTAQPVDLYIGVDDVDAFHEKIRAAGVEIAQPLTDQWWGDRNFVILDPNGYRVWFFTTVGEPSPPPGTKIV